jgi:hypothetical protein
MLGHSSMGRKPNKTAQSVEQSWLRLSEREHAIELCKSSSLSLICSPKGPVCKHAIGFGKDRKRQRGLKLFVRGYRYDIYISFACQSFKPALQWRSSSVRSWPGYQYMPLRPKAWFRIITMQSIPALARRFSKVVEMLWLPLDGAWRYCRLYPPTRLPTRFPMPTMIGRSDVARR